MMAGFLPSNSSTCLVCRKQPVDPETPGHCASCYASACAAANPPPPTLTHSTKQRQQENQSVCKATRLTVSHMHAETVEAFKDLKDDLGNAFESVGRHDQQHDLSMDKQFHAIHARLDKIDASMDTCIQMTRGLIGVVEDVKKKPAAGGKRRTREEVDSRSTKALEGALLVAGFSEALGEEVQRLSLSMEKLDRKRFLHCNMPGCTSAFFGDPEELPSFCCAADGCQGAYVSAATLPEAKRSKSEEDLEMLSQ